MVTLFRLLRGGFLKAYRAQTLGIAAGLGGIVNALASWAVGDRSFISLVRAVAENWAVIAAGFGLATVAAKIDRGKDKTAQDIADEALRRN